MSAKKSLCIADATSTTVRRLLTDKKITGPIVTAQEFLGDCDGKISASQIELAIIELPSSKSEDIHSIRQQLEKRWPDVVIVCLKGVPAAQTLSVRKEDSHFVEVTEVPNLSMKEWARDDHPHDRLYVCTHGDSAEQRVKDMVTGVFLDVRLIPASTGSAATLCNLVGAMQTIECIAISEAFMVCHLLKIDKSQLLRVLHHGSAKSDVLTPFSTDSSKGVMLPSKSTLDNWKGFLEVACTHASDSGFPHTLPRTAIASIATLFGELESVSAEHAAPQEPSSKAEDPPETSPDDLKKGDKVLVIGLGLMGIGIAKQLSKHVDTLGYDIDESRTKEFAKDGGKVCENVQEDCREAAFVVVVVESEEQVHEALFDGPEALSENLKDDATIVIHSTVSPGHASKVQERFSQTKPEVVILDAPMSGTPTKAEEGKILVILGGTSEGCAKYELYLKLYTSQILKFPRLGLASQLKLLHNTVAGCNLMAAAYTLKLGHSMGFERSFLHDFIAETSARSTYFEDRVPRIISNKSTPSAHLSVWLKDLSLAIQQYAVELYFSPLLAYALEMYRVAAIHEGNEAGDHDVYDVW